MKTGFKKIFLSLLFPIMFFLILIFPETSFSYAATGLTLWFDRMVPTLLPFMIFSTLLIRQNLTDTFVHFLHPLFGKLYGISKDGVYCLFLGFLCGFPMGARTIGEMYDAQKITKREASLLLSFCNNIGPVYYISFFLPVTGLTHRILFPFLLFGIYGIPLLYGFIVHHTNFLLPQNSYAITKAAHQKKQEIEPFTKSLDYAIDSGIHAITVLGAYMILCNLLNLFPHVFYTYFSWNADSILPLITNCLFEITGGIARMGSLYPLMSLILLPLQGLSCLLQTQCMIKYTDLSISAYIIHKIIQTLLTTVYYFLLFFLLL